MRTVTSWLLAVLAAAPMIANGQEHPTPPDAGRLNPGDVNSMIARELELALEDADQAFGLANQDFWVTAAEFYPWSGDDWIWNGLGYFYTPTGSGMRSFEAQLALPAGALVTGMQCFFNDTDTNDNGTIELIRHEYAFASHTPTSTPIVSVTSQGSAGYQAPFETLAETIRYRDQGLANFYTLIARMPGSTVFVQFRGCRLNWRRQVSPAPSVATFDDVATGHPFFQYVEAMAASGITGGCDANSYCPEAPLTRGQMAVFLATALGLHWQY